MEVQITPEQEAKLATLAARLDRSPGELVLDAALKMAEEEDRFRAAVRKGLEYADLSEFIEEAEMDARVERMLQR
jgi:predicted transcriptional regulator